MRHSISPEVGGEDKPTREVHSGKLSLNVLLEVEDAIMIATWPRQITPVYTARPEKIFIFM
jgi:hypothetical protein